MSSNQTSFLHLNFASFIFCSSSGDFALSRFQYTSIPQMHLPKAKKITISIAKIRFTIFISNSSYIFLQINFIFHILRLILKFISNPQLWREIRSERNSATKTNSFILVMFNFRIVFFVTEIFSSELSGHW